MTKPIDCDFCSSFFYDYVRISDSLVEDAQSIVYMSIVDDSQSGVYKNTQIYVQFSDNNSLVEDVLSSVYRSVADYIWSIIYKSITEGRQIHRPDTQPL